MYKQYIHVPTKTWTQWKEKNKFSSKKTLTIWISIYKLNELGEKSANPGEQ